MLSQRNCPVEAADFYRANFLIIKEFADQRSQQSASETGEYCPEKVQHRHPPPFGGYAHGGTICL
jgi:hypothetical protein